MSDDQYYSTVIASSYHPFFPSFLTTFGGEVPLQKGTVGFFSSQYSIQNKIIINCDPILENPTYRAKIKNRVIGSGV